MEVKAKTEGTLGGCYRATPPYPSHPLGYAVVNRRYDRIGNFAFEQDAKAFARQRDGKVTQPNGNMPRRIMPWCIAQRDKIIARFHTRIDCVSFLKYRAEILGSYHGFYYFFYANEE